MGDRFFDVVFPICFRVKLDYLRVGVIKLNESPGRGFFSGKIMPTDNRPALNILGNSLQFGYLLRSSLA